MRRLTFRAAAAAFLLAGACVAAGPATGPALAQETVKAGSLELSAAWIRTMLPGQSTGGGYVTIRNTGGEPDRLLSISAPGAAHSEIHMMGIQNDVMVMRPVEGGLEIPAGGTVELKPGGFHLMFMNVAQPWKDGTVAVTFTFEKAGVVEVPMPVQRAGG